MVTNGAIPTVRLSKVDATHYAAPGCTAAFRAWSERMVALGYRALTVGNAPDSCYRSLAWQNYRWNHQPPLAAYPGTSNHGLGMAIDIGNYYRYPHRVLVREGKKYGFRFDTASEAWHVKFVGAPNYKSLVPAGDTIQPLEMEFFMPKVLVDKDTKQKYRYAVWDGGFTFDFITGTAAEIAVRRDRKLKIIGQRAAHPLTPGEFLAELADVNSNRAQAGIPKIVRPI